MFKIRNEQAEEFPRRAILEFEQQAIEYLTDIYPEEVCCFTEEQLLTFVRLSMAKANSYEIVLQPNLVEFMAIQLELGQDFDTNPQTDWAIEVLTAGSLNETEKIAYLRDCTDRFGLDGAGEDPFEIVDAWDEDPNEIDLDDLDDEVLS
ncbi:MAG: hypothetical protein COA78_23000 [Blastopirellula sp.]|nr:MAG: hypothetical protein COA78_23000 [Blastopirellula sp.]